MFFERSAFSSTEPPRFDITGFLLLAIALGAYSLSMTSGIATVACILIALIALALFITTELRVSTPLVSVSSLKDRAVIVPFVALALVTTIVMATLIVG